MTECKICNKFYTNEYSHIKSNHKNLLKDFLIKNKVEIRYCNVTNELVLPKFKNNSFYFTDKVKLFGFLCSCKQMVTNEILRNYKFNSHKEKMMKCFNISNDDYLKLKIKSDAKKGQTLENFIRVYGEEEGTKKHNEFLIKIRNSRKNQYNLDEYIKRYGTKDGIKKYNEFKFKTSGSIERYIKKYGEEEGAKKYNSFCEKCNINNKEYRIQKYGEEKYYDSLKKYNNRINNTDILYYLKKTNGNYIKALKLFKERQTTSTLSKFIKIYGDAIGEKKYNHSLRKIKCLQGVSKIEVEFSNLLYEKISNNFKDIYHHKNPYLFYATKESRNKFNKKVFIPDFYIKDINIIIEFFGDFWHCNPKFFNENDRRLNTIAENVWQNDSERILFLKKQYNVDTLIIWENDFRKNKELTINNLINEINDRKDKITNKL